MEVRYQLPVAEYAALQKKVSKRIYKSNKMVRRLQFYDMALFLPFIGLAAFICFEIQDLQDILMDCYEADYSSWLGWILLIGSYFILLYSTTLRPAFVNKIFRSQVTDELAVGEQVVRIQEDGLYLQNTMASSVYSYAKIHSTENIDGFLVIFLGNGYFAAIPHNAFADEAQRLVFENLLKSKMAQNESLSG